MLHRRSTHKWLGCMLRTVTTGNHDTLNLAHQLHAGSKTFDANRPYLVSRNVAMRNRFGFFNAMERSGRQEISNMLTYRQIGFSGRIASPPSTEVRKHFVFRARSLVKPFGPRLLNSRSPEEAQRILRGPRCTNLQPMLTRPSLPTQKFGKFWCDPFVSHSVNRASVCHAHTSPTRSVEIKTGRWSLMLLVSVLPTEKCTNKICAKLIPCFAGCCVPCWTIW